MKLDKASPIPLYYQLAERLREQIEVGELKAGAQLPSERELSEQSAISRMTARQAVTYLVREGVLEVRPGIGTFVAAPKLTYDALHLLGFTEEAMRQGGTAQSQVLEQVRIQPSLRVASGLQLPPAAYVIKIVRVRLRDDTPVLLETSFIPATLCPEIAAADLAKQSLYGVLEEQGGVKLAWSHQTFEATIANEFEQKLFALQLGTPMILLEGVTYTDMDQPVEYFKAIYRGDRFKFALESRRNGQVIETAVQRMSVVLSTTPS